MKKCCLAFILISFNFQFVLAQHRLLSGTVVDTVTGEPIPYASVGLVDSYVGTSANDEGKFELYVMCKDDCLIEISSIGYRPKRINALYDSIDVVMLEPAATMLKEVEVFSRNINEKKVVKTAFKAIRDNYISEPFIFKSFYRHYSKENDKYTRLVEIAFDIYKEKGYGKLVDIDNANEKFKLTQLRRTLDQSTSDHSHSPNSIKSCLAGDVVSYQSKEGNFWLIALGSENFLYHQLNDYHFDLVRVIQYDSYDVFEISFRRDYHLKKNSEFEPQSIYTHTGKLYIRSDDYAILKYESDAFDNDVGQNFRYRRKHVAQYKKFGDRYALFHILQDRTVYGRKNGNTTNVEHIEVLNTEVLLGKNEETWDSSIGTRDMASISYNPAFWDNYNVLKANPLEEKIIKDLVGEVPFEQQFSRKQEEERYSLGVVNNSNKRYRQYLEEYNQDVVYIEFWGVRCKPCIREFQNAGPIVGEYKKKGVKFLHVSIDSSQERWEEALKLRNSDQEIHLRIGNRSSIKNELKVVNLPRYVVYYKGKLYDDNAPSPASPAFSKLMDKLLRK